MTQTSTDSAANSDTSTGISTSTVIMNHDKIEKKGTDFSTAVCSSTDKVVQQDSPGKAQETEELTKPSTSPLSGNKETDIPEKCDITGPTTTSTITRTSINNTPGNSDGNCDAISEMEVDTNSFSFSKAPMCAICSEPCIYYCKLCKKVSYCSKEHQKKHWKQHRPECYPVTVQLNSVFGSHLVVTRDIKRGEVILREKPLVYGPFMNRDQDDDNIRASAEKVVAPASISNCSVCLSCHKLLWTEEAPSLSSEMMRFSHSSCSKCGWPVCSPECERNPIHASQECKLFAEYHVQPSALCDKDAQYLCVALLRILLQKEPKNSNDAGNASANSTAEPRATATANTKWTHFMDVVNKQVPMKEGLNSQLVVAKKATSHFVDLISNSLGPIIHQEFSVTDAEIDQIVRTLRTSSFITDRNGNYINGFGFPSSMNNNSNSQVLQPCYGMDARNFSRHSNGSWADVGKTLSVYHLASMLTSNCTPNASWIIHESLEFYLRASAPIKTGERITITFVDPSLGTWLRRERLWQEKYLSCSCSRCSDPTESCTFFSAIKCPGQRDGAQDERQNSSGCDGGATCECEGYILPTDPLAVTYTSCHGSSAGLSIEMETDTVHDESSLLLPPSREKLCEDGLAEWKCNVCLMRQPWSLVQNSLKRMESFFCLMQHDICFTTANGIGLLGRVASSSCNVPEALKQDEGKVAHENVDQQQIMALQNLEARVNEIDNLVGKLAHPNHYHVLKMENEVLTGLSKLLEKGQVPFEQMEKWALKMIELCKKGLKVVNVLCPGLSRERGRLLYFLQQGLAISLLFKTSREMRIIPTGPASASDTDSIGGSNNNKKEITPNEDLLKKFNEVILARKEILEIFAVARANSEEGAMLKAVQHDSIEMRLLKNHFKYHQHVTNY